MHLPALFHIVSFAVRFAHLSLPIRLHILLAFGTYFMSRGHTFRLPVLNSHSFGSGSFDE